MSLSEIPEWLATAIVGAVAAVLGFVAKSLYEFWSRIREAKAARLGSIINLYTLLTVSKEIFVMQNERARELFELLEKNHPDDVNQDGSMEANFLKLYDKFLPEEKAFHELIRSWTEHSLYPINTAALEWLRNDNLFRTAYISANDDKGKQEFAVKLIRLHVHLLMWEGKYNAWIPNNPKHALIYLADEEQHGFGFPPGLDQHVEKIISDLLKNASPLHPVPDEPNQ